MGGKSTTLLLGLTALFALPVAGMMLVLFFFAPGATVETAGAACSAGTGDQLPPGGGEGTVRPVQNIRVYSPFGAIRNGRPHHGVDYGYTGMGATIYAFAAGKVVRAGPAAVYGNTIVIDHNIRGQKVSTLYAHMKAKDIAVRVGDTVKPGQGIAKVGSEGNSSGPHLHFEYYVGGYGNGRVVDPHPYVQAARAPGAQAQGRAVPAVALAEQAAADEKDPLGGFRLPKPDGEGEQGGKAGAIPSNYLTAYKAAGQKYGVPWQLLAGIGWAETRHGTSGEPGVHSGYNTHGCCAGPMQFYANREMAGGTTTWDSYGVDGNGDGVKNVYDIGDAAFAAANYLVASGVKNGPQGVWKALYAYNHLRAYANDVLSYAWQYATGDIVVGPGNGSGQCDPGGGVLVKGGDKSRGTKGADPKNLQLNWPPEKATIDDPTTNGKLTPRMARTLQAIKQQGPSKPASIGCYRPSDAFPDHPGGYACDLMYTPANKKNSVDGGWVMANWLVANQKTLAVKYVIWQGKIWSAYREPGHWRPYTVNGCPEPSNITVCHYDHVHVTVY